MNDIELYEIILKEMLYVAENNMFKEHMDDRLLIGELEFLVMIIQNLLDKIPDKKLNYDIMRGLQTRLREF